MAQYLSALSNAGAASGLSAITRGVRGVLSVRRIEARKVCYNKNVTGAGRFLFASIEPLL